MRTLYIALAVAAALAAGIWWHATAASSAINAAVMADRAVWQAQAKEVEFNAAVKLRDTETKAGMAALEGIYAQAQAEQKRKVDAARAASQLGSLRDILAATLRSDSDAASQGASALSLIDGQASLTESLSRCSGRYVEVAAVADELSVQVTGLQRYVRDVVGPVCVAGEL